MSDRSAKATQDIIEYFDRSPLTKVPSDCSLRVHGARWSNVSLALSGDSSMHDLSDIREVQGLSLNKTVSQARLSRPASLDGGFAYTETPSATDSMVDVHLSTAGTYITAPDHTSYPKSQMPLPFELPATTAATQKDFDCNPNDQTEAQAQNSVQLECSITDTITSDNHEISAQGTCKPTIFIEGTETSQGERVVDGLASSLRKLVSFQIQDEHPKQPISPATNEFKFPPNGKTEFPRPLSTPFEEHSGLVAMRPVPFAVEPLYKKLCSSNPSLADFIGSEHSDDLDLPHKVQDRTSKTLEGQPGLGASSADHNRKQRRVVDWVGTIPDSPCSNSGSIDYDDLGIFHARKAGGNGTVSVYQRTSNVEESSILGTSARYGNTDFKEFWKKAEAKSISPGPFSPEKGHFSPPSSAEVSPRPDGPASSQQKGKGPLLTTTIPSHLKNTLESSLGPALERNLLHALSASLPTATPPAISGSARSRGLSTRRLPTSPIPHASESGSSISTELSPSELALGPANSLETSVSLDHLRPAPIPKVPTHEDHLHPALRAYPFFNPADHVDNGIAPVHGPTTRKAAELGPRKHIRFTTEEPPTLSRDYMESPMRGEFAQAAKEMSTKAVLRKVKKSLLLYLSDCGINDRC